MENPFLNQSPLNLPLQLERCQEIHWRALHTAARGLYPETVPEHLDLAQRVKARKHLGAEVYYLHPDHIAEVFRGLTSAHYRLIETLYCSRLGRSIKMIALILSRMAEVAGKAPVNVEAIWAICLYLEERLQKSTGVKLSRTGSTWQLVILEPEVVLESKNASPFSPQLICLVELEAPKVLAYRVTAGDLKSAARLAIYDALSAGRRPETMVPGGLVWQIPACLYTETDLEKEVSEVLHQHFQIQVQPKRVRNPLIETLRGNWDEDLAQRVLPQDHFERVFDNYLTRIHGYGPKKAQADLADEYAALVGYNLDPGSLSPQLRLLLPEHEGVISSEGQVVFEGSVYTNPLLTYWSGQPITLRQSAQTKATAWIYLNNEILCEARSQESRASQENRRWR